MQVHVFGKGPVRGGKVLELQRREPLIEQVGFHLPESCAVLTDGFFARLKEQTNLLQIGQGYRRGDKPSFNAAEFDADELGALQRILSIYPGIPLIARMTMAGESRGIGLGKSTIFNPVSAGPESAEINLNRLMDAVKNAVSSGWTSNSIAYRLRKGLENAVDILIMPLIGAETEKVVHGASKKVFMPEYGGIGYSTFGHDSYSWVTAAEGFWTDGLSLSIHLEPADPASSGNLQRWLPEGKMLALDGTDHLMELPVNLYHSWNAQEFADRLKRLEELSGIPLYVEFATVGGKTYLVQIADAPERRLPNLLDNVRGMSGWGSNTALGLGDITCERIVAITCPYLHTSAMQLLRKINQKLKGTNYLLFYPGSATSSEGNSFGIELSDFYNAGALLEWGDFHANAVGAHVRGLLYDTGILFAGSGIDEKSFNSYGPAETYPLSIGEIRVINRKARVIVDDRVGLGTEDAWGRPDEDRSFVSVLPA
jgi:hypothetical protein